MIIEDGFLGHAEISYVKWDMNRVYNRMLFGSASPPGEQGKVYHRYILGVYRSV